MKRATKALGTGCLNNLKQLQFAWQMYADDHADVMPPNLFETAGGLWRNLPGSWVLGHAHHSLASTAFSSTEFKSEDEGCVLCVTLKREDWIMRPASHVMKSAP